MIYQDRLRTNVSPQRLSQKPAFLSGGTVGRDGRLCSPCPASTGPNDDRSDCVSCPSGQVSPYGVCVLCDGNAVPNAAADGCVRCSTNQIAVDGECVASVAETTAEADEPKEETLGCISDSRSSDGSSTATLAVSSLASLIAGIVIATAAVKTKPEYFVVKLGLLGDIGDRVDLISADKIAELRAKLEQLPQVLLEAAAADTASTTPNDGAKTGFGSTFDNIMEIDILPRHALDEHRENSKKNTPFVQAAAARSQPTRCGTMTPKRSSEPAVEYTIAEGSVCVCVCVCVRVRACVRACVSVILIAKQWQNVK